MFNPTEFSYFRETRQPIYSAALVLPFLLIYEAGLVCLRSNVINGGDAVLLNLGGPLLRQFGVEAGVASVLALILVFICWQFHRKGSWQVEPPVLAATLFESLIYAVLLFVLLTYFLDYFPEVRRKPVRDRAAAAWDARAEAAMHARPVVERPAARVAPAPSRPGIQDFVLFCGAGVYEELVFRVLLLGLLMLVLTKLLHLEHAYAAAWAVILGAFIFSGFHHIGGEPFALGPFLQRVFAGVYFAAIYVNRSFGIAAASHALYDILVGLNQLAPE
jgi:hypothetical protein